MRVRVCVLTSGFFSVNLRLETGLSKAVHSLKKEGILDCFFLVSTDRVFVRICVCVSKVDCYDYNNSGSHDFIGSFQTTLVQIQQASQTYAVSCVCVCVFSCVFVLKYTMEVCCDCACAVPRLSLNASTARRKKRREATRILASSS